MLKSKPKVVKMNGIWKVFIMSIASLNVRKVQEGNNLSLQELFEITTVEDLDRLMILRKKSLIEGIYFAELDEYLEYENNNRKGSSKDNNYRNGFFSKRVYFKNGSINITVPRDREGKFTPKVIKKNQSKVDFLEDWLISCSISEMSIVDIEDNINSIYEENHLTKMPTQESVWRIADKFNVFVRAWQTKRLKSGYAIILIYQIPIKEVFKDTRIVDLNVSVCVGVEPNGNREIISMHSSLNQDNSYWNNVINDLLRRGVRDVWCFSTEDIHGIDKIISRYFPNAVHNVSFCKELVKER